MPATTGIIQTALDANPPTTNADESIEAISPATGTSHSGFGSESQLSVSSLQELIVHSSLSVQFTGDPATHVGLFVPNCFYFNNNIR